ncbi:MAG: 1-(5-phosphoribosyl)-5-[(5-phosphoribosylamino)methylideneamino]imidazole-4-carboxamide isomerase [Clostridia bacterium]|nr:1-(5-phosphoribosyl)-5-[(5-phosphoribosylamino)methylideneamino]imidazole-4-carboxamide isomerase [Clostridia bacterium]
MKILPAIDLYGGNAVRLYKGDYAQMTVYSNDPASVARDFVSCGADEIHLVDLEGAKSGALDNFETVRRIVDESGAFCEIGGGIRSFDAIEKYADIGIGRVILGTAAVCDNAFLVEAVRRYGEKIAVGADIKDGRVAIKGWTEKSDYTVYDFCDMLEDIGVKTLICTDVSKDGAMVGTNRELYRELSERYNMNIIASGGVSTLDDVAALTEMGIYGAIIGKAYYTGAIDLKRAIEIGGGK